MCFSNNTKMKIFRRCKKKNKIRQKIYNLGTYRLTVFKTLKHIYAQIFTFDGSCVLASASSVDKEIQKVLHLTVSNKGKKAVSSIVGEFIAKRAVVKGIARVSFDRSGLRYHGRIKELANAARKFGLIF